MSCLFDSLSSFLTDINSTQLRHLVTQYLSTDPSFFQEDSQKLSDVLGVDDVQLGDYVANMANSHTWGGAIEIRAFCEMFQTRVLVEIHGRRIEFLPKEEPRFTIHLHYTGNHYEPISISDEKKNVA